MKSPIEMKDPRRLETVIGIKDFASLYNTSPWKAGFLASLLEAVELYFGTEVLLKIPDKLKYPHPSAIRNLPVLEKLRACGLLEQIAFIPTASDEPPLFRATAKGKTSGMGAHFLHSDKALWSALGECIERSLWLESSEWYEGRVKNSSFRELSGKKLDPLSMAGFSETQKNNEPILRTSADSIFGWIRCQEWVSGESAWVPLQLLSARYANQYQMSPTRPHNKEVLLRPSVTTGLATASNDLEEAILYGALEVIERDAFMVFWLNRLTVPRIDQKKLAESSKELEEILESIRSYDLDIELLLPPTDFPFATVIAAIFDKTKKGPAFSIGAKSHWDMERAIQGALSEALAVRLSRKDDFQNPVDMSRINRKSRLIYWAKPENTYKLDFMRHGEKRQVKLTEESPAPRVQLPKLRDAFRRKGYPLYVAEISSKKSKEAGFRTVCVSAPDLHPMHLDERAPALGSKRLTELPVAYGYAAEALINLEPHPFP